MPDDPDDDPKSAEVARGPTPDVLLPTPAEEPEPSPPIDPNSVVNEGAPPR